MYVYVCVYMCVCACVCVFVYVFVCMRARVRVVERSGGCSPACLPRLSGALPDRTLNPARLNLGIIRGYKVGSVSLPFVPRELPPPLSAAPPSPQISFRNISFATLDRVPREGTQQSIGYSTAASPVLPREYILQGPSSSCAHLRLHADSSPRIRTELLLRTRCANIFAGE